MTTVLLVLAGLLVLPLLWVVVRTPGVARLAVRNVVRRRGEAVLVVAGAMLGTAIITASVVTGDVIEASIQSGVDGFLGPVDVRLRGADAATLDAVERDVLALGSDEVDGTLTWVETTGSVVVGDAGDAGVNIAEVDLAAARAFGGDLAATGLAEVETLAPDEVVLIDAVAADLGAQVGDTVTLHLFGASRDLTVTHVVERVGLAGYAQVLTAPGTVTGMAGDPGAAGLTSEVLVSLTGGVRDAATASDDLTEALRGVVEQHAAGAVPVTVHAIKADVLRDADATGTEFTTLFSSIGAFAVIAGVLLLVNLFVMLAEERRRDLGTLRALGMRRSLLARTFALEGALYAGAASLAGVAVGAVVGLAVAWVAGSIFAITDGGLRFSPVLTPSSLLASGLVGFVLSMVTAWALSIRIGRANIIRSLRQLPEPPSPHRLRTVLLASVGILVGAAVTALGITDEVAEAIIGGLPLALLSAIALARTVVPVEWAMGVGGSASIAWALVASSVWSDAFADAEMTVFVVQGVVLVAGAVTVLVAVDRVWRSVGDAVVARTGGIAARLGTAYPLARRSRTALLLGMFAIVVFTMTFISSIEAAFTSQMTQLADDTAGGWDLYVEAPASATDADADLLAHPDVTGVAPLRRNVTDIVRGEDDEVSWLVTTLDERLLTAGTPTLARRAATYADDAAVFAAVVADPDLIVVGDGFGQDGGPGGAVPGVGDTVTLASADGVQRTFEVVGVLGPEVVWNGAFASAEALAEVTRPVPSQAFYVAVDGDPATVASRLDADLVGAGVDARTFHEIVGDEIGEQSSFMRLLQVFLGLGLVIGVAGLGVVLVRAVRERTRQVGTLRAIGVPRATVARAFLVEAGFISVQGVVVGAVLGLVSAWQVITRTDTFGQVDMAFVVPWTAVLVIAAVPLLAAVVMTLSPARRAASIRPAVALRVAD